MYDFSILIPMALSGDERLDRFEDPICDLFDEDDGGDLIGSGCFGNQDGIISYDIQVKVVKRSTMNRVVAIVKAGGAPPNSIIKSFDRERDEMNEVRLDQWTDLV